MITFTVSFFLPYEPRAGSAATPRDLDEAIHCTASGSDLTVSELVEQRRYRGLEGSDDVVVSRFPATLDRHEGLVQEAEGGEKHLAVWGSYRCKVQSLQLEERDRSRWIQAATPCLLAKGNGSCEV